MKYKKEQEVQKAMEEIIRKHRGFVYKNQATPYSVVGLPDLTACVPIYRDDITVGVFVAIECKLDSHKYGASDAQKIVGDQIKKAGGVWLELDDPEALDKCLTVLQYGNIRY